MDLSDNDAHVEKTTSPSFVAVWGGLVIAALTTALGIASGLPTNQIYAVSVFCGAVVTFSARMWLLSDA